jgi:hypothetical protein
LSSENFFLILCTIIEVIEYRYTIKVIEYRYTIKIQNLFGWNMQHDKDIRKANKLLFREETYPFNPLREN